MATCFPLWVSAGAHHAGPFHDLGDARAAAGALAQTHGTACVWEQYGRRVSALTERLTWTADGRWQSAVFPWLPLTPSVQSGWTGVLGDLRDAWTDRG